MTVQQGVEQEQQSQQQPASSTSAETAKEGQRFHTIEEYRKALKTFSPPSIKKLDKNGFTTSDELVDEYFHFVSCTGAPQIPWEDFKPAFLWKLQTVMNDIHDQEMEKLTDDQQREQLKDNTEINELKTKIMEMANAYEGIPFTIQRICELLYEPTKHYHNSGVFLRAMEKNVNVVTTITEEGQRVTGASDNVEMETEEEGAIPVEQNFIVSVDELDEPLAVKYAKQQKNDAEANEGMIC